MQHFEKTEGFFLLLQRGGCSFQTKMKNAVDFGAEVLIISDYLDKSWAERDYNKFDESSIDGQLRTHIPTFEIEWEDAKKMVNVIYQGEEVVYAKATFDITNDNNKVEVDLYYSTSLDLGTNLSQELAAMSLTFEADHPNKPLFTPRIASYDCLNCDHKFKRENCYNHGAYCGYTPNFYTEYDLDEQGVSMTGREILEQALRERCLHDLMTTKYRQEGNLFFTFFAYLETCFAEQPGSQDKPMAKSLNECYDWSTVMI